jgi:large subunit ribosomal protein L32
MHRFKYASFLFLGVHPVAVAKSRKSRSRRGMRNAHRSLTNPTLSIESATGETHRRHHISKDGYYKGKQVITPKTKIETEE